MKKLFYIMWNLQAHAFQIRFPKSGATYRRQVINPRHQTPQRQSVAKPGTPL